MVLKQWHLNKEDGNSLLPCLILIVLFISSLFWILIPSCIIKQVSLVITFKYS